MPQSHHLTTLGEPKVINSISALSTSEVSSMGLQKHLVSARMIPDKTLKQRTVKEKGPERCKYRGAGRKEMPSEPALQ